MGCYNLKYTFGARLKPVWVYSWLNRIYFISKNNSFLLLSLNNSSANDHYSPRLPAVFESNTFFRKRIVSWNLHVFLDFLKILKNFLEKIEKFYEIIIQKNWHVFGVIQGKIKKLLGSFWIFSYKSWYRWKWFFANISRTVRDRAKILVKINP